MSEEGFEADRLGPADGDLLVDLDGAPIFCLDDLFTVLRIERGSPTAAIWIRAGSLKATDHSTSH